MHRSCLRRVCMLLVVLSAIAACAPVVPTPTRVPEAAATSLPTFTPTRAPGAIAPLRATWTLLPTPTPVPTTTPAPTPVAVYPPLAALARGQVTLDGSTSTQPLRALIACQAIGATCYWDSYYEERSIQVPSRFSDFVWKAIGNSGTHGSYVTLMEGKTDVILVARVPSAAEIEAAKELGVTFDARPVALDALVFLVNVQNPLNDLPLADVRSIYAGRIKDWGEVGGTPGGIKAYQREDESGSQELLKALVMKDLPPLNAPEMVVQGMGGPFNRLDGELMGVGYSVYYYATTMYPDGKIKLLSIDGIPPTSATIAARTYPLAAEVYVVVRAGLPEASPTLRIRDWLLSEAGQAAVKASGYVPVPPVAPTWLASPSRVQWAYKMVADMPSYFPVDKFEAVLNTHGNEGWEYMGDPFYVGYQIALFKRPSSGTDKRQYRVLLPQELPEQASLLGKDGWDAVGGFATLGGQILKRAESHSASWEYQTLQARGLTGTALESALNQVGAQGWEVYFGYSGDISLKRPRAQPGEWRYEIVGLNMGVLDAWNSAIFGEEGRAGWEYVAIHSGPGLDETAEGEHFLFKRPSANATPWEYKGIAGGSMLSGPPEALERFLNKQGQEGWELIDMTRFELLFRRPL